MTGADVSSILIAGGGLGCLAAALALARNGRPSIVLEQAPQFGEIGAGIQIAPNQRQRRQPVRATRRPSTCDAESETVALLACRCAASSVSPGCQRPALARRH